MNYQFLFIGSYDKNIEGKDFCCINVLEFNTKKIFTIYKISNESLKNKISSLKNFQNINDLITFAIKRDSKITLDIKI